MFNAYSRLVNTVVEYSVVVKGIRDGSNKMKLDGHWHVLFSAEHGPGTCKPAAVNK